MWPMVYSAVKFRQNRPVCRKWIRKIKLNMSWHFFRKIALEQYFLATLVPTPVWETLDPLLTASLQSIEFSPNSLFPSQLWHHHIYVVNQSLPWHDDGRDNQLGGGVRGGGGQPVGVMEWQIARPLHVRSEDSQPATCISDAKHRLDKNVVKFFFSPTCSPDVSAVRGLRFFILISGLITWKYPPFRMEPTHGEPLQLYCRKFFTFKAWASSTSFNEKAT